MNRPTFSIIVPLYNKADYVVRAVDSVYEQKLPPKELIIVDDISTDGSAAIAQSRLRHWQKSRPEISVVFLRNARNSGPGAARNRGLKVATSDFVLFLDADDEYQPTLLSTLSDLVTSCHADAIIFAYQRQPGNTIMPPSLKRPVWLKPELNGACELADPLGFVYDRRYPVGPGSNVAVKRRALLNLRYDESARVYEGIDFWFRVIRQIADNGGRTVYLMRPHHTVHGVPDSLIRKTLTLSQVEYPKILRRYALSVDRHERQLFTRVAKMWFINSYKRLDSVGAKTRFVLRYSRLLICLFNINGYKA